MHFSFDCSRIQRLRRAMLVKPTVCVERARLITESYRQTEGEPAAIRRGKAFAHLLAHMTVRIYPDELIVGRPTSQVRGGSISPELQCDWILDELDLLSTRDIDPFEPLTPEDKAVLREVVPFWQERSLRAHWSREISPEAKRYDDLIIGGGAFCGNNQFPGHSSPDYGQILRHGTTGLIEIIAQRMQKDCTPAQRDELQGMILCLEALGNLGDRYADEAERLVGIEADPVRRGELEEIARVCRVVPRHPARTFRQAVQSVWFTYYCVMLENWGTGNTFLRVDQYLYPYYLRSRAEGVGDEELFQYAAALLINCNCNCVVYSEARSHGFAGNNSGCSFTLGGCKSDGSSAVNELSYLFLEAERAVNMGSDDLVIRIGEDTPDEFVMAACEVARDVGGKLKFLGDKTTVRNLMIDGMSREQASDYAIAGCTSPVVGGLNYDIPGGIISLPGILELALNNGVHRLTGLQLGLATGSLASFTSFDQIWDAFCAQVRHVIPFCHEIKNLDKALFSRYMPSPLQSSLLPPCIEAATDVIDGGTKPFYCFAMSLAGAPNVGNALAAIKKWVFEKKAITLAQLQRALEANFEGYEDIRALLLRAPKFGNDDPYVDAIVNDVLCFVSDVVAETPGFHAAVSTVAAAAVTANIGLGMVCGATPDGRRAGEPISEGGISPAQGSNSSGATSTMMSVARLDHSRLRHGEVLNLRMNPSAVSTAEKLRKFERMIRTYVDMGGFLVQFNIVSTETLKDAQLHPEKHRDLVVRVATYAAYFVELGPEMQDDIIRRMEFLSC
ncbi:MAG: hypothetical protein IJ751_07080 [Oscillospiraceae bacterium]|nr:hypothetical protein [Oscillospiraceae bacterium]